MGEGADGSTAQCEPDGRPDDEPRQPAEVVGSTEVDVVAEIDVARQEPAVGACRRAVGRRLDEDEVPAGTGDRALSVEDGVLQCGPGGRRAGATDEQHQVGLADALQAPRRRRLVGEQDQVVVARLETVEVELGPHPQRRRRVGIDRAVAHGGVDRHGRDERGGDLAIHRPDQRRGELAR